MKAFLNILNLNRKYIVSLSVSGIRCWSCCSYCVCTVQIKRWVRSRPDKWKCQAHMCAATTAAAAATILKCCTSWRQLFTYLYLFVLLSSLGVGNCCCCCLILGSLSCINIYCRNFHVCRGERMAKTSVAYFWTGEWRYPADPCIRTPGPIINLKAQQSRKNVVNCWNYDAHCWSGCLSKCTKMRITHTTLYAAE